MMTTRNVGLYLFFLSRFRNGLALIENYRRGGILAGGPILAEAKLWDGTRLVHPPNRAGMVGILVETWYNNVYRIGDFYSPNPGDLVVDAGAHVGLFSLWLNRRYPGVRNVALEPSPENYPCLSMNVASAAAGGSSTTN